MMDNGSRDLRRIQISYRHILVVIFGDELFDEFLIILIQITTLQSSSLQYISCRLVHIIIVDCIRETAVLIPTNMSFMLEVCRIRNILFLYFRLLVFFLVLILSEPRPTASRVSISLIV